MAIEIVDFPIKNGGSFHSYVKLPEGIPNTEILTSPASGRLNVDGLMLADLRMCGILMD